ncbi:MAG: hypothetical protein R3289_06675 [Photobacterium sp.]|nr:hypothetical protein [Photobacterium sp.]
MVIVIAIFLNWMAHYIPKLSQDAEFSDNYSDDSMIGKASTSGLNEPEKMVIAARISISTYFPQMMHNPMVFITELNMPTPLIYLR